MHLCRGSQYYWKIQTNVWTMGRLEDQDIWATLALYRRSLGFKHSCLNCDGWWRLQDVGKSNFNIPKVVWTAVGLRKPAGSTQEPMLPSDDCGLSRSDEHDSGRRLTVSPSFEGGLLVVWGCGEFGQHGHGHVHDVPSADAVGSPLWLGQDRLLTSVACGSSHTLAITGGGGLPNYNPGQKYMVHLENLLCFHRPLFDDESGSFSQIWPSPPYNVWNCQKRPSVPWLLTRIVGHVAGMQCTEPKTTWQRSKQQWNTKI